MNVRLISISKPCTDECLTSGDLIAYCARVSNPTNQANTLTAPKLLAYLVKNKHWSPFEMVSLTVEIETTRDIARQILRHRSFSFQEFSQRYAAVDTNEFTPRELRMQDKTNRQSSNVSDDAELAKLWLQIQERVSRLTALSYQRALSAGIAKEVARVLLPEGLTPSRLYMAGTVRSFIHYVQLRTEAGTQKEHRDVAEAIRKIVVEEIPALVDLI